MTDYDRQPPQDLDAEQCVLGAMLLSRDAITAVVDTFGDDADRVFYRPIHQLIYDVIVAQVGSDEPTDAVTVAAALSRRNMLHRLGGAPYLHTLISTVPTAANAAYYAEIVAEKATLRRVVEAGTRIVQLGYQAVSGDDVEEVVAFAQETVGQVSRRVRNDDSEVVTLDALLSEPETPEDWVVPGLLERMDRLILTGWEGLGKALSLITPVITAAGWSTVGELRVGDEVFGPDGQPTKIVATTDVMIDRPCYRVTFSDGAEIIADANHLWLTETLKCREAEARFARRSETTASRGTDQRHKRVHFPAVVTTEHIRDTLHARNGHVVNHAIPVSAPLQFPTADLPVDPYLLGAWLGDGATATGSICLNRDDADSIQARLGEAHRVPSGERPGSVMVRVEGLTAALSSLGVLGHKHIPEEYLYASEVQRRALLAGLMDTDGHIIEARGTGRGQGASGCELTFCDARLAADALDLLLTLGIKELLVQLAFGIASGVHPFTGAMFAKGDPMKVLIVDGENTRKQLRRRLGRVLSIMNDLRKRNGFVALSLREWGAAVHLVCRPDGMDLSRPSDVAQVERALTAMGPDLLVVGPLYKLAGYNTKEEEGALKLLQRLDQWRVRHNCALIAEAHAGHEQNGQPRSTRPRGSAVLKGWPEFGLGLATHEDHLEEERPTRVHVRRWRGDREVRDWPRELKFGGRGRLPWVPFEDES
jgi:hypothetical protein